MRLHYFFVSNCITPDTGSARALLIDEYDPLPGTIVTGDVWDFDYSKARLPEFLRHNILEIRRALVSDMKIFDDLDPAIRLYEERMRK